MQPALLRTPLHARHRELGARLIGFGGWEMPLQYDGILAEHQATRTGATIFDTCHMGRFFVTGAGALDDLSRVLTADLRTLADGQCRYGFLLREDAGVLDDLIVYRFGRERWMLVVNAGTRAKDVAWIRAHLSGASALEDASERLAKVDVQGPRSLPLIGSVLGLDVGALGRFRFRAFTYGEAEAVVSRTGYTGEAGAEIYVAAGRIVGLWNAFLAAGVKPAGLGARDTLRLEAGLPLYGHELSEERSPLEAGLERFAAKQEDFVGRGALEAKRRSGPSVLLAGFRVAGRQSARAGNRVLAGGVEVGQVASGSFSPTLGCSIGFAFVARQQARVGGRLGIDTGRNLLDAELVRTPFYSKGGNE